MLIVHFQIAYNYKFTSSKREILKQTKQVRQQSSKLLIFLSAHVPIAFKIIVKFDYLERYTKEKKALKINITY